jgi:hypothetical protein
MFENVFLQIWHILWPVVALVALEIGAEQIFGSWFPGLEGNLAICSQILQNVLGGDEVPAMLKPNLFVIKKRIAE